MMWGQILFALVFLLLALPSLGQTKADSISSTAPKFLIRNQQKQVLLVFDANRQAWEIPGTQYAGPITFRQLADSVAKEYGISYKQLRLAGLFTYHYPGRYKTIVRPYFTVAFTGFANGKNFRPNARLQWVNPEDIRKFVLYPASVMIVDRITSKPKAVWAGAFEEYGYTTPMTDPKVLKFRVVELLYQLR